MMRRRCIGTWKYSDEEEDHLIIIIGLYYRIVMQATKQPNKGYRSYDYDFSVIRLTRLQGSLSRVYWLLISRVSLKINGGMWLMVYDQQSIYSGLICFWRNPHPYLSFFVWLYIWAILQRIADGIFSPGTQGARETNSCHTNRLH